MVAEKVEEANEGSFDHMDEKDEDDDVGRWKRSKRQKIDQHTTRRSKARTKGQNRSAWLGHTRLGKNASPGDNMKSRNAVSARAQFKIQGTTAKRGAARPHLER